MIATSLTILLVGNICLAELTPEEKNEIESLNKIQKLEVFGDVVTIISKNDSKVQTGDLNEYLKNHLVRIKLPLKEEKFYDFELSGLIRNDDSEGRRKKRRSGLIRMLIPLLLALKIKSSIIVPFFMMTIALIAIKGLWAGMTALFISKALAFKILYHPNEKQDHEDHEDHEEEDHDEFHDHYFTHQPYHLYEHSDHGHSKPIVIYLDNNEPHDESQNGYEEKSFIEHYHSPETYHHWNKYSDFDSTKWHRNPQWERGPRRIFGKT